MLWLLAHDVPPARIRWIMPRDAWMLDRGNVQMAPSAFARLVGGITAQLAAIADAESVADLFARVEAAGQLVRLDPPEAIVLERGTLPFAPGEVVVDCSASAVLAPPPLPVFDEGRINLPMVRTCQPTFSGALIGLIASLEPDIGRRRALEQPVPSPNCPIDWLRTWGATIRNRAAWAAHPGAAGRRGVSRRSSPVRRPALARR
ncbi:MAG: hypothetical protein SFU84_06830 [Gemmatimonadales bacterium]|nr:hypothetical protein [Gemmatimonadales bacterium]